MTLPCHTSITDLLGVLPDAVLMVDAGGRIVFANEAVRTLLGYAPGDLLKQDVGMLIPASQREGHAQMIQRFQREGVPTLMGTRSVLSALHRNGERVPVSISLCNWDMDSGERVSVAVLRDVADLHTHLTRARALAETDPLTGLGNRLRLSRWMQQPLAHNQAFALLYMDLRHFKRLNDELGHAAGDMALQHVASRLKSHVRTTDLAVRLGGDEFVMLFGGLADRARLAERARVIATTVARPFRVDEAEWSLGISIGGALHPRHGHTEAALLQAADLAMYRARETGQAYCVADD